jgi:hypothetical protein
MISQDGRDWTDISYIAVLHLCCTKSALNVGCAIGINSTNISMNGWSEVVSKWRVTECHCYSLTRSWYRAIRTGTRPQAGQQEEIWFTSWQGQESSFFSKTFVSALGPNQFPVQWVTRVKVARVWSWWFTFI